MGILAGMEARCDKRPSPVLSTASRRSAGDGEDRRLSCVGTDEDKFLLDTERQLTDIKHCHRFESSYATGGGSSPAACLVWDVIWGEVEASCGEYLVGH